MRTRHFRNGPAWRENLAEAPALPASKPEAEMPRTQIMALLEVRGGGPDSLFAKVLDYLRAVGSDEPDACDRTRLRDAGYLRYRIVAGCGWDEITPAGQEKARQVAREMARQFQIHHVTIRPAAPRSTHGPTARCSCGHFSTFAPRSQIGRLHDDAARHLEAVKAGTWKVPRPVEAFIDEIAPPQLPFDAQPRRRSTP